MNPRLILLNGPLGVGKSTQAKIYSERNPLALSLDIDLIRMSLGSWREYKEVSGQLAWKMALEMARVSLTAGNDVVIAQNIRQSERYTDLEKLATESNGQLHEILLFATKDDAVRRFVERGQQSGFELGYKPDGLIDRAGGISRVEEMYDEMMELSATRSNVHRLNSKAGEVEDTYSQLLAILKKNSLS